MTGTISHFLATRKHQSCRLLYQASSSHASPSCPCILSTYIPSQHTNYYACLTDELVPRTSEGVLIENTAIHTQQLLWPSRNYYKVTWKPDDITQVTLSQVPRYTPLSTVSPRYYIVRVPGKTREIVPRKK